MGDSIGTKISMEVKAADNSSNSSTETSSKPAGMSFSDWKKMKYKTQASSARRSLPSVPALSIPEGGPAIVKVAPPVRPAPPKPTQHHFRRPAIVPQPMNQNQNIPPPPLHHPMPIVHKMPEYDEGWQKLQNPFKNGYNDFIPQLFRPPRSLPQPRIPSRTHSLPKQKQKPKQKALPREQSMPQTKPQGTPSSSAAIKPQQSATTKPYTKKFTTPWIPKPKMPPPMNAITPESKEEKQKMWRDYRQAMKPFKNREFHNAKRVIQRLGKKNITELDEKELTKLLRAQEFVAAHKQKVSEKATESWVRAIEQEVQAGGDTVPKTEQKTEYSTPPQIYVRQSAPICKPHKPQHEQGNFVSSSPANFPQVNNFNTITGENAIASIQNPPTVYGGSFVLGGQLITGPTFSYT